MKFSQVKRLITPEGRVTKITSNSHKLWADLEQHHYVSLGDSIAVGHAIDTNWEKDYGYQTQYGENGNTATKIVPGCYTELIHNYLAGRYGKNFVTTKSFAHSGDTTADLRGKLEHTIIKEAVEQADLITICIGANDILGKVLGVISDFIAKGSPVLEEIESSIEAGFVVLESDASVYGSYRNLFAKIQSLNTKPNARFVFTNVYNPYKYLWLDASTDGNDYTDGFFGPLFWAVPNIEVDIPFVGQMDIRKFVHEEAFIKTITERINNPAGDGLPLSNWVETKLNRLNGILTKAIEECDDPRFKLADTKSLYESFPDRHLRNNYNYSDLVNVEIVRGQTVDDLDWGEFWDNWSVDSLSNIVGSIADTIVNKVILPDTDPHPEDDGHYVMYRSFADVMGWENLTYYDITYNANGGTGTMPTQKVVATGYMWDINNLVDAYAIVKPNAFAPPIHYYHAGWSTTANGDISYSSGQAIIIKANMSLYAQWSNMYTITYMHSNHTNLYGDDETGHMECYELWIDGVQQEKLGKFNENKILELKRAYGTPIGFVCRCYNPDELTYDDKTCRIYVNDVERASGYREVAWNYPGGVPGNMIIDFRWKIAGSLATFNAQSWEDCHITIY